VKVGGVESSGEKNSLDPAVQPSSQNSLNAALVYNRLTDRDDNWGVHPELATSWKPSNGGKVWTFQLRHGVEVPRRSRADLGGRRLHVQARFWTRMVGSDALSAMGLPARAEHHPAGGQVRRPVRDEEAGRRASAPDHEQETPYIVANGADDATIKQKGAGTGPFMAQDFGATKEPNTFVRNPNYWEKGKPAANASSCS
jgi:peptide/nickel transport system substrate-binding protein